MNLSLNRIILFVRDVEGLKNFYQQHFKLHTIEETADEWVVMNAGSCQLALHKIGNDVEITDAALSNTKLVFETDNDLSILREKLLSDGVTIGNIKSFDGFLYLLCDGADPEGNVFQLVQKIN